MQKEVGSYVFAVGYAHFASYLEEVTSVVIPKFDPTKLPQGF
jgi:hypothetical protein